MSLSDPPRGVAGVAAADPDRVALVCGEERVTFGALDASANAVAHRLAGAGVGPGDRVAVLAGNGTGIFAVWNGVARLGALVVPVSYRLTSPEIAYILADSGATVFVHDGSPAALEAAAGVGSALTVDEALADPRHDPPGEEFLGSPVTVFTYTSGTTGRPKGIARAAPAPAREAATAPFAAFWGFGPTDVHLLCGPAYHTAPGAYAQMTLVEGGRVVIMPRWDATECLRLIESEGVTTSHMVPANFIRILEADWEAVDRSSVRRILHAAAPCPVPVKRRILEVFPAGTVWEYYGASEGMASVASPEDWLARPGTVGRPFPGLSVKILDEEGRERPPGEIGQIYISAFPGHRFEYHNAPEKTEGAWKETHFTVGDLGSLDAEGYLFLADRRTDLIISGGVNIYPAEVETALIEDDAVVDAAVYGIPDDRMGAVVHAVVEVRPGAARDAGALLERLATRLAGFKAPRTVEFVDELPREPNGKVLKTRLRERHLRAEVPPG